MDYLHGIEGLEGIATPATIAALKAAQERRGSGTAGLFLRAHETMEGKPRAVIFTDGVLDANDAAFVAAHEVAGHHGLRALLGDKLDVALKMAMQNPVVRKLAEAIAKERGVAMDARATEEALAELQGALRTGDFKALTDRYGVDVPAGVRGTLGEAVKNFLRRLKIALNKALGRANDAEGFTDAQLRDLLQNAWRAAKNKNASVMVRNADGVLEQVGFEPALESSSRATQQAYEARIDALFGGAKPSREGVRILDEGDVLTITGFGNMPVVLNENHGFDDGQYNHPLTTEQWKALPEWIDNPAAVFERASDGHLTVIAPEKVNGKAVVVGMAVGKSTGQGSHLVLTVYPKDRGLLNIDSQVESGHMVPLYIDQRKGSSFYSDAGLKFSGDAVKLRASNRNLKTGRDLVKYRAERDADAPLESTRRTPADAHAQRGQLLGSLAAQGYAQGSPTQQPNGRFVTVAKAAQAVRGNLFDRMQAGRDMMRRVSKEGKGVTGVDIDDAMNFYRLENAMAGAQRDANNKLLNAHVLPIQAGLRNAGLTLEQFEDYLYAKAVPERNAEIAKINKAMPDAGAGETASFQIHAAAMEAGASRVHGGTFGGTMVFSNCETRAFSTFQGIL